MSFQAEYNQALLWQSPISRDIIYNPAINELKKDTTKVVCVFFRNLAVLDNKATQPALYGDLYYQQNQMICVCLAL